MTRPVHRPVHRSAPRSARRLLVAAGAGVLVLAVASPATAGGRHHPPPTGPVVVASGLDNPRQLTLSGDALYVAEAGTGGDLGCVTGPEGDEVCLGDTGAVTRVDRRGQRQVVTGLPSLASADGSAATGPSDVAVDGSRYAVLVGLGADPAARAGLPAPAQLLGTLLGGRFDRGGHHHGWRHGTSAPRVLADVSAYEASANPDGAQVDSNPVGLQATRGGWVVADAGGNDVVGVSRWGSVSTVAVLPQRTTPAPPFLPPGDLPLEPVPTSAVVGPDGALYVSQLTGFPFPAGASNVYRVVPGQAPTVWASGLTNVTDLAWQGGRLYAVQLADEGLLATPEGAPPSGSVVEVVPGGTPRTVADDLVAPYGIALAGRSAYVTTCSVCPGGGEVVRLPLR